MTTDHSPTTPRPATVADTIVADLRETRGWVCGSTFYATYRPTFAQRISELNADYARTHRRREGDVLIYSRVCRERGHEHRSTTHEYALRQFVRPEQLELVR